MASNEPILAAYRCGPAVVNVAAEDPGAARWLAEFLTPWFEAGAPAQDDITVRLRCSAPAFANLECRQRAANSHPVACFVLDSQVLALPGWVEPDGGTVVADRALGCFYRVRRRSVEIVALPGARQVRYGLMRVVRELAAARILGQGTVLDLHAAALTLGERAVLLAGAKGTGKTTLLVYLLASGGASLIANDRVFVEAGRQPGRAIGVPTLVALRERTLRLFPDLRRGFPKRPALLHAAELDRSDTGASEGDDTPRDFALSPAQLARRLGVGTVGSAPIAAIVFPELAPAVKAWAFEPITPAEGAERLRQCLYGTRSRPRPQTIFQELSDAGEAHGNQESALLDRLAAWLPLRCCRLGPDAYRDSADAWVRALSLHPAIGSCVA